MKNAIALLKERNERLREPREVYEECAKSGPEHRASFVTAVHTYIGGVRMRFEGGPRPTKKAAKLSAAETAWAAVSCAEPDTGGDALAATGAALVQLLNALTGALAGEDASQIREVADRVLAPEILTHEAFRRVGAEAASPAIAEVFLPLLRNMVISAGEPGFARDLCDERH